MSVMITPPITNTIPIEDLMESSIAGYKKARNSSSKSFRKIPLLKKIWNEHQIKKLLNNLFDELEPYMSELRELIESNEEASSPTLLKVKTLIIETLKEIDSKKLFFEQPFLGYFIEKGYMDAAEVFLSRAKKEDAQLTNEEIFQALRNVWIMNSLQLYWGIPLHLTDPMYAYSMLYPYTDNLLDDPDISSDIKCEFNIRLSKALSGETVITKQLIENRIFALVRLIHDHYPQAYYPEVTESIQLIHEAQISSMLQTQTDSLSEEEIMHISFFKGGTSVLADAYLVKGVLTTNEMAFSFQYGAFLQLLDDLQDKTDDEKDLNQTLFSTEKSQDATNKKIRQLIAYIHGVNNENKEDNYDTALMKNVISQCTLIMIMEAVGKNPEIVSSGMYKELESYSKVRLSFYKELETKMTEYIKR